MVLVHFFWFISFLTSKKALFTSKVIYFILFFSPPLSFALLAFLCNCSTSGIFQYTWKWLAVYTRLGSYDCHMQEVQTSNYTPFKGQCYEIFDPRFFSANNTPVPAGSQAEQFWIWICIREDIRHRKSTLLYAAKQSRHIFANFWPSGGS
jgi:hypothetical protein